VAGASLITQFYNGDAIEAYPHWDKPTVIISDGPYGISGYDGDLGSPDSMGEWYDSHISMWSDSATPNTTLWFWNTEVGWAEVHPVLKKHGWIYRGCNIWDKGIGHIAGNCNTKTMRKFPVVTEVCAHYVRSPVFSHNGGKGSEIMNAQQWLRNEWQRTGLAFTLANEACGVKDAATRKYLTKDHNWYFPPPDVFTKLSEYANQHGDQAGKPYFAMHGKIVTESEWKQLRAKFYLEPGITNVWSTPGVRGKERLKDGSVVKHSCQKPLSLMERLIKASSDKGDIVWEPFGGLFTASIAASSLGRIPYAAEIDRKIYVVAKKRYDESVEGI
jgi:DNA modification methylase